MTTASEMSLIGRTLAHFHVESKLGEGGMGVVYRATDESLRREVALKVLSRELAVDDERHRRFLREARLAASVTHPAIATVYEVGEADGLIFIAMELVPGENMRQRMAMGISIDEIQHVAREVAQGLARAHDKGIVHRDLKPDNVMITPDGDVKILDFGVAKLWDSDGDGASPTTSHLTAEGFVMGTPGYMSPEQIEGRANVDARSDIFAFGVMMYELLTGVRPFRGANSVETLFLVLNTDPDPLELVSPQTPPAFAAIISRCLRKSPAERFNSGRELAAALGDEAPTIPSEKRVVFAEVAPVPSTAPTQLVSFDPKPTPAQPPRRSRRVPIIVAALLSLGLVAAVIDMNRHRFTHGVAMTDHPLPGSANHEAVAHYASALSRLRIGALESATELEKATALDPTLAAAQLRLALYGDYYQLPEAERRRRYTQAIALIANLDARDKALLPVAATIESDPIDYDLAIARIHTVSRLYPDDAEIALLQYLFLFKTERPEAEEAAEHVLELDPMGTQVFVGQVRQALGRWKTKEAAALADRCLELNPAATVCRDARMAIGMIAGKCDAVLVDARELVRQEPDVPAGYDRLAQALAATGAPQESIRDVLEQAQAHELASPTRPKELSALELAVLVGDFATADDLASKMTTVVATANSELENSYLAMLRIELAEETGNRAGAIEIADTFEREAPASTTNAPLEVRAKRLYLRHEAGMMSDADFDSARDHLVSEASHASGRSPAWTVLGALQALQAPGTSTAPEVDALRLFTDAAYTETVGGAKRALPTAGALPFSMEQMRDSMFEWQMRNDFGRLLFLAGRVDEAIPLLSSVASSCSVIGNLNLFDTTTTLSFIRAQFFLGQALEVKGDKTGACRAYGVIEKRWGGAKPRSVTLEKATARSRALSCPAGE